jgi:hypothetical protein
MPTTDPLPSVLSIEIDPAGPVPTERVTGRLIEPTQSRFEITMPSAADFDYDGEATLSLYPGRIELPVDTCEASECLLEVEARASVTIQITR